jgi:N-acetylgalactosamine-N,N'-diacetylbacillosaminyl-diphospho-undecaprenol 4-alpha-N-acetylgalactosaminyltransferase
MAEAMVLGRAVVATDCPSGPSELLGGSAEVRGGFSVGEHGLLVCTDDAEGMAAGMCHLAEAETASAFGKKGAARVEDFRVDRIAERYRDFIREIRSLGARC